MQVYSRKKRTGVREVIKECLFGLFGRKFDANFFGDGKVPFLVLV